jgi:hypothetical protein
MLTGGFDILRLLDAGSHFHHSWPFRGGFVLTVFFLQR